MKRIIICIIVAALTLNPVGCASKTQKRKETCAKMLRYNITNAECAGVFSSEQEKREYIDKVRVREEERREEDRDYAFGAVLAAAVILVLIVDKVVASSKKKQDKNTDSQNKEDSKNQEDVQPGSRLEGYIPPSQ